MRPGTTELEPSLATAWEQSDDGTSLIFTLRDGVRFHDGTTFEASAVCANFQRWHGFRGVLQSPALTNHWQKVFGGFATRDEPAAPAGSLYRSCDAPPADRVVLALSRPSGLVLSALALPAFSIASPDALQRYGADRVAGSGNEPRFEGTFATQHPIGTGPFRLRRWARGDRVEVKAASQADYLEAGFEGRLHICSCRRTTGRAHRRAGGDIEAADLAATGGVERLAELARHWYESVDLGEAAKAVHHLDAAARRAFAGMAFEEAAVLWARALDCLARTTPVDEARRTEILIGLTEARQRSGDCPGARDAYHAALKAARAAGVPGLSSGLRSSCRRRPGRIDRAPLGVMEEAYRGLSGSGAATRAWCWPSWRRPSTCGPATRGTPRGGRAGRDGSARSNARSSSSRRPPGPPASATGATSPMSCSAGSSSPTSSTRRSGTPLSCTRSCAASPRPATPTARLGHAST